ncbi:MAG: SDR family oxidoreductase [Pseudomonadota bacterium]
MNALHADRVVWVTGAASGIGRATVEELVAEGARVIATDLPGADFSWAEGRDTIAILAGDVTMASDNEAAVSLAEHRFGRLDGAVLNAGMAVPADLFEAQLDVYERTMSVNVLGVVLGLRAASRAMKAGSAITVTASISGLRGDPGMWIYNTSKAAVINLVRSTSMDLAAKGIRINAVCPGPIDTGMTAGFDRRGRESLRQSLPLKRWGDAAEVGSVHSWLLSAKASFITGAYLPVDGGVSANNGQFRPRDYPAID